MSSTTCTCADKKGRAVAEATMATNTSKQNVLVVLATGKLGYGICQAFLDCGGYNVFGTSRDPKSPKLCNVGIIPIKFQFDNIQSMESALEQANADVAVLITDFITIAQSNTKIELRHARVMIDSCKKLRTKHVILCSSHSAAIDPEICKARNITNKLALEIYLRNSGIENFSILRPSSFFENYDEPRTYNPLTRGYLSDLYPSDAMVSFVATYDVGKAAVAMANDTSKWRGKCVTCVSCVSTGAENTRLLSTISKVPCTYKMAPPTPILWLISSDLYHMVQYVVNGSQDFDPESATRTFHDIVPDAMGMREWLVAKGKWSDGTKFGDSPPNDPAHKENILPKIVVAAAVAIAIGYATKGL